MLYEETVNRYNDFTNPKDIKEFVEKTALEIYEDFIIMEGKPPTKRQFYLRVQKRLVGEIKQMRRDGIMLVGDLLGIEELNDYGITSCGRIWSFKTGRFLSIDKKHKVGFSGKHSFKIGQLVAKAYIPNPNNYKYVGHKDGNPDHNWISNLVWTHCNYYDKIYGGKS